MSALLLRHSGNRLRNQVSLVASVADAEDAAVDNYVEALLPGPQNVFVLEGDFGSDTDATQVVALSSSAQGLGVAPLALPFIDSLRCARRLGPSPLPYSTVLQRPRKTYFHQGGASSLTGT